MVVLNVYSLRQIKERGARYELSNKFIRCPKDAYVIIRTVFDLEIEACEKFGIITLTTKNEVAGLHILSMGSLNASIVHPREVFKAAMLNNAASFLCFHNHPSGDPTPSSEDYSMTRRLKDAGELLGIELLDHIVIGRERFVSMKEEGSF